MKYLSWALAGMVLWGCSRPAETVTSASRVRSTSSSSSSSTSTVETPLGTIVALSEDSHLFSITSPRGETHYLALPDMLSVNLIGPTYWPQGGPHGEGGTFGVLAYPAWSERIKQAKAAYEAAHPGVSFQDVHPVGTTVKILQTDWLASEAEANTIFFRRPSFGVEERSEFPLAVPVTFSTYYQVKPEAVPWVEHLSDNHQDLELFFHFRFCYRAQETGASGELIWEGRHCVSSRE